MISVIGILNCLLSHCFPLIFSVCLHDNSGGYSHVKTYGDAIKYRILGQFFEKKSLNMGPTFHAKIPNYGSDAQYFCGVRIFWKFRGFLWQNRKKMVPLFWKNSLNMDTYFRKNYPWTWVGVLSCPQQARHIPDQSKSENPNPPLEKMLISRQASLQI